MKMKTWKRFFGWEVGIPHLLVYGCPIFSQFHVSNLRFAASIGARLQQSARNLLLQAVSCRVLSSPVAIPVTDTRNRQELQIFARKLRSRTPFCFTLMQLTFHPSSQFNLFPVPLSGSLQLGTGTPLSWIRSLRHIYNSRYVSPYSYPRYK